MSAVGWGTDLMKTEISVFWEALKSFHSSSLSFTESVFFPSEELRTNLSWGSPLCLIPLKLARWFRGYWGGRTHRQKQAVCFHRALFFQKAVAKNCGYTIQANAMLSVSRSLRKRSLPTALDYITGAWNPVPGYFTCFQSTSEQVILSYLPLRLVYLLHDYEWESQFTTILQRYLGHLGTHLLDFCELL